MMIALLATIAASSLTISSSTSSSEGRSLADCDAQHDALDLLQRKSQAVEAAHRSLQSQSSKEPKLTITSFEESECSLATGAELNISEDACFFGWTYACSCQGNAKVAIAKHYQSLFCNDTSAPEQHHLPLGTCLDGKPTSDSDVFQTVSDHGTCPCCGTGCSDSGKQVSLPVKEEAILASRLRTAPMVRVIMHSSTHCSGANCCNNPQAVIRAPADGKDYPGRGFFGSFWSCDCLETKEKALHAVFTRTQEEFVIREGCHPHPIARWLYTAADLSECPPAGQASCTVHGDPHISVFDQAEVALLGIDNHFNQAKVADDVFLWGDFWLVKSEQVQIQARYRKVYYPKASEPLNNTYLTAVAIGGPFLRGYTLMVEPRTGSVTWALAGGTRKKLFEDTDSVFEHEDLIKARYSDRMPPIVPKQAGSLVSGLDVELPSDVKLKIDRFAKHLDARIEMAAAAGGDGGVDGQCGNFNGDPTDDTAEMLEQRMGNQVPKEELLFS